MPSWLRLERSSSGNESNFQEDEIESCADSRKTIWLERIEVNTIPLRLCRTKTRASLEDNSIPLHSRSEMPFSAKTHGRTFLPKHL